MLPLALAMRERLTRATRSSAGSSGRLLAVFLVPIFRVGIAQPAVPLRHPELAPIQSNYHYHKALFSDLEIQAMTTRSIFGLYWS